MRPTPSPPSSCGAGVAVDGPAYVVDDGSTDGTAKVLADLIAELGDPRLDVVTHEHNRGKEHRCAVPSPESPASTSSSRMPT